MCIIVIFRQIASQFFFFKCVIQSEQLTSGPDKIPAATEGTVNVQVIQEYTGCCHDCYGESSLLTGYNTLETYSASVRLSRCKNFNFDYNHENIDSLYHFYTSGKN